MKKYDVIVIGGGISGIEAASRLAREGKKTALIERSELGGTAVINGALKIKYILDFFKNNKDGTREELIEIWDDKLLDLEKIISLKLEHDNLDIYNGEGKFLSETSFEINGELLDTDIFIISIGTKTVSPYTAKIDGKYILTHENTIELEEIPNEIAIINGGIYGPELANIYVNLGVRTTLIDENQSILSGEDDDHIDAVRTSLIDMGVNIIEDTSIKDVILEDDKVRLSFLDSEDLIYEKILISDIKEPNYIEGMKEIGIRSSNGYIFVNESFKTNVENIYAIGDVNGIMNMINIATEQANRVVDGIFDIKRERLSYELLPRGVFTEMEIAGVGYQERQCQILGLPYKLGKCYINETWGGWTKVCNNGFIKVILDYEDNVIGLWTVGENVTEYIGFFSLIIENKTKAKAILTKLIISPSIYEAVKEATYRAMVSDVHLHNNMFDH